MDKIKVRKVTNPDVIRAVLWESWDTYVDDSPVEPDEFEPSIGPDSRWYAAYDDDDQLVTLWLAHRLNHITWQIHIHFLSKHWGKGVSTKYSKRMLEVVWKNTEAKKLCAVVPEYADYVLRLAKRVGFKQEGRIKKSWQKNDKRYDQINIGVYR